MFNLNQFKLTTLVIVMIGTENPLLTGLLRLNFTGKRNYALVKLQLRTFYNPSEEESLRKEVHLRGSRSHKPEGVSATRGAATGSHKRGKGRQMRRNGRPKPPVQTRGTIAHGNRKSSLISQIDTSTDHDAGLRGSVSLF